MSLPEGAGGTFALPSSSTHAHAHQIDVTSAVRSLRRSISRSPSRFLSRTSSRSSDGTTTPASPQSPCRRFRLTPQRHHDNVLSPSIHAQTAPPAAAFTHTPNAPAPASFTPLRTSTKLSLRSAKSARTASPSRQIARARASPKSPLRRALKPSAEQGNAAAQHSAALFAATSGHTLDQENTPPPSSPAQSRTPRSTDKPSRHSLHLDVSGSSANADFLKALDAKIDFSSSNVGGLKRNDAMMNFDQPYQGSPVPKRRSMHGVAQLGDSSKAAQGHHPLAQIQTLSASSSGNSFSDEPEYTPDFPGEYTAEYKPESTSDFTPGYTYNFAPDCLPSIPPPPPMSKFANHPFSRSLPAGAERPGAARKPLADATPSHGNVMHTLSFGSTGLISKVNRNPEQLEKKMQPPDTPCKPWRKPSDRFNTYPIGGTPSTAKKNRGNNRNSFAGISSLTFQPPAPTDTPQSNKLRTSIFDRRPPLPQDVREDQDGEALASLNPTSSLAPPTPTRNGLTASLSNLSNLSEQSEMGSEESLDSPSANRKSQGPRSGPLSAVRPTPLRQPDFGSSGLAARRSPRTPQEISFPQIITQGLGQGQGQLSASRPSVFGGLGDNSPATPTTERDFRSSTASFSTPVHDNSKFQDFDVESTLQHEFDDVTKVGDGEFSLVYRVKERSEQDLDQVYVVKKSKRPYMGNRDRENKLKEARVLQALTEAEHVVQYIGHWEANDHLYIQTEYCENGNLKDFYAKEGFHGRLDDFCIFKILLDLATGLKEIHDAGFMHLDMKPANVFVTFEGALKIGDFGLARSQSDTSSLDTEGDREYMAPEVLYGKFGCSSDIFSLGLIILEAIANVEIPGNGDDWRKLRADDFSGVPSLAWTASCETNPHRSGLYSGTFEGTTHDAGDLFGAQHKRPELLEPPAFMEDMNNVESLRSVVGWMMASNMNDRPTADALLSLGSLQWIAQRRSAPATIFEGRWGPVEEVGVDVVDTEMDTEMTGV